jgi:hypothetical protein
MINHKMGLWRKVFQLSATFLLCLLFSVSCKKRTTDIGISSLDKNALLEGGGIDTFSLTTFTELDDTVITKNSVLSTLGSYNDPVFGKINASIFTQIRLVSSSPTFEDISRIVVDSMVLSLKYAGYTGKSDNQTFEVFELNDTISAVPSVLYYKGSSIPLKSINLVDPNADTYKMKSTTEVIIDTLLSVPQLRIKLDTNLAKKFIMDAASNPEYFNTADAFISYFKGICIRVNNPSQSVGSGGIGYFALTDEATKLTIYYRVRQEAPNQNIFNGKQYSFRINSSSQRFNRIEIDRAGTKVDQVINMQQLGQTEFYAQAYGARAVVRLNSITDLPKNTIIHKAELFLPVQYQLASSYNQGSEVTLAANLSVNGLSLLNFGLYSDFRKGFVIDVRNFVQQVVSGRLINTDLYIAPKQFISSADRIIFNGQQTTNKLQPKLTLIYTAF